MTVHTNIAAEALIGAADALMPDIVALRRAIHADPELGLHNPRTTRRILDALAGLPLEIRQGPSTTGIIAILEGTAPADGPKRSVLLRGDMDALPLEEDTGLDFASETQGAMHACGHDTHVAMLVGAVKLLAARRESFSGTVMFMFQPGEEGHHGARFMLDDGLINPLPDAAFAFHIMPNAPWGLFAGRAGPLLASSDKLHIRVTGKGGHASMPHDALDPVPVACEIVSAIQAMVTRKFSVFDPAVITIGRIDGGTTDNIIPEHAEMWGTIRTLSPRSRALASAELTRLAGGIASAHGASAEVTITEGFPVTVCDARAVDFGKSTVEAMFGADGWRTMDSPIMGAEDFAYVLERTPGAMFFLGAAHQGSDWRQCCGLHSNRMVLDDSVMARGAALHAALAERFLAEGWGE